MIPDRWETNEVNSDCSGLLPGKFPTCRAGRGIPYREHGGLLELRHFGEVKAGEVAGQNTTDEKAKRGLPLKYSFEN